MTGDILNLTIITLHVNLPYVFVCINQHFARVIHLQPPWIQLVCLVSWMACFYLERWLTLTGWLFGWLADRLDGWLVGLLAD